MQLTLTINLDGAAFHPPEGIYDPSPTAIRECLDTMADKLYRGATYGNVRDENGNTVGHWEIGE
jgi:hypothetical protein